MTQVGQMNLTLEAASLDVLTPGNYAVEVWEEDWYTGFVAKTIFTVTVKGQAIVFAGFQIPDVPFDVAEDQAADNSTSAEPEADPGLAIATPTIEYDCNGNLIYSWQRTQASDCSEGQDLSKFAFENEPLTVKIHSFSQTGNLRIQFN